MGNVVMKKFLTVFLYFLLTHTQTGNAFYFQSGYEHIYTYTSHALVLSVQKLTTIIKFRLEPLNKTSDGGSLVSLQMDSFIQKTENHVKNNPKHWDFDKRFLFHMTEEGLVGDVHHEPDEDEEVLMLKKVLASTISAKAKIPSNKAVNFVNQEVGHAGQFDHSYHVYRALDGLHVVKSHQSVDKVYRSYNKTMRYSHSGTLRFVAAEDRVVLKDQTVHLHADSQRQLLEGEMEINDTSTGDLPDITTKASTQVKLEKIRKSSAYLQENTDGLIQDSILVKQKIRKTRTKKLSEVKTDIEKQLQCILTSATMFASKRLECVKSLRETLSSLIIQDYRRMVEKELSKVCKQNDIVCQDRRNLFIDIVSQEDSLQVVLVKYFLRNMAVNQTDLERVLMQCITLKNPSLDLLSSVKDLCFGQNNSLFYSQSLTKIQKKACLSLGALVSIVKNWHKEEVHDIVSKFESWLSIHNETHSSAIIQPRKKRAVDEFDQVRDDHIVLKMVLLHAIGNTGMSRSLQFVFSYMEPNKGHSSWRLAAIQALRNQSCNESAAALVTSLTEDHNRVVRDTALNIYRDHPQYKGGHNTEHKDWVLRKAYNYPTLVRLKRGLKDGIHFQIRLPGLQWKKRVGNSAFGAEFGLTIRNGIEVEIKLLSGFAEVDIYDDAYAQVMLGWFGITQDVFRAKLCYQGHVSYDLNLLKDFGINSLQDLVNIFDKVFGSIIRPIKNAIDSFKKVIQLFRGGLNLEDIVNKIVDIVRKLPIMLKDIAKNVIEKILKSLEYIGAPWIRQIQKIILKVRYFVEDIERDVLGFYNTIADAITVTLPYVSKKLFDSVASIIASFKNFLRNPVQSIFGIGKSVLDIRLAIGMFIDVKNRVVETFSFLNGKAPFWINYGEDLTEIIGDVEDLFDIISSQQSSAASQLSSNISSALTDGIASAREQGDIILQELHAAFGNILNMVKNTLDDIGRPFFDAFQNTLAIFKDLKSSYEELRNVIIKVKSLVQKIFGPKFHLKFPARRRDEISGCGQGVWPTTTNDRYKTIGVDVRANEGRNIVCPVSGIVKANSTSNRVILEPRDDDFIDLEVVIDNVVPNSDITADGLYMKAGEDIIGQAGRSPCQPNFIHVAVRKVSVEFDKDEEFEYVDPSAYLDRLIPYPQWIEECKERIYWHIGMVMDADTLGKAADRIMEEIGRASISGAFDNEVPEIEPVYRPPGMDLADYNDPASHKAWDDFKDGLKNSLSAFKDIGKQLFDFSSNRKGFNILDYLDINKYTIKMLKELVDKSVSAELELVLAKLAELQNAVVIQQLDGLSMTKMRQLLRFAFNSDPGDKSKMISRILSMSEQDCPDFKGHIVKGQGHICFAHPDCLGLTCGVNVVHGSLQKMFEVDIRIDKCLKQLNISSPTTTPTILDLSIIGDYSHNINIGNIDSALNVTLTIQGFADSDSSIFSAHAQLCALQYDSCLPEIEVLADFEMASSTSCSEVPDASNGINEDMTIEDFLYTLSAYHLLDKTVLDAVDTLREAALKEIVDDPRILLKVLGIEFKNKVDFCSDVTVPFPTKDVVIFSYQTPPIFVGPIPIVFEVGAAAALGLRIEFGVCFLSCSARAVVTPWAGIKLWGDARVELGIFRAGIQLIGYLLDTRFPISGSIKFNKLPLGVVGRMDLVLVPLRLKLVAYAEFGIRICIWKCFRITITIFRGTLWEYRAPAISGKMFERPSKDEDKSAPQFVDNSISDASSKKNETISVGCLLKQIPGRDPTDTAFQLQAATSDDDSDVKLYFAIGTQPGGRNVMDWTDMGGALLVYVTDLPNGIALYWTLKAVNSQGMTTYDSCYLDTYDNTPPDGRVDPSYIYSSHPHTISGTVRVFDDSPLVESHLKSLGYSSGQQGQEVVSLETFVLESGNTRTGIASDLKYFGEPRKGKLTSAHFETHIKERPADCATVCLLYKAKCVSFDYDYFTEKCELQSFVEGPSAKLRISGTYVHYERLDIGEIAYIEYTNLNLTNGNTYFINAQISNVLGYSSFMTSTGTMVDFTPPETGPLGPNFTEVFRADGCSASVDQRCKNVTWKENHRIVHDGPGSSTVFNGHKPMEDMLYTRANHFTSVTFDGFHDRETGIYGYMWAVGTAVCQTDIFSFLNPHEFLHSSKHWTHSGYKNNLSLSDGYYYTTVQALNNVIFGGSLVTTVCHTTPFVVDTTPPDFGGVTKVYFDEDFDMLGVYYNASDNLSHLHSVDFGLGKSKYDVLVRRYSYHAPVERSDPYLVVEELGLEPGVPAWIRIRPVNNVGLFRAGHGSEPILIDRTAPIPGQVLDGFVIHHDLTYQSNDKEICAQWTKFYDPESGVEHFLWGVGTVPGKDDIVAFHNYTHNQRYGCVLVQLQHNTSYYSTVVVFNGAMNSKQSNSTSNGVLIDITPPEPGTVHDGKNLGTDISFSSETASKHSYWDNFTDPESDVTRYETSVFINDELIKTFNMGKEKTFTDHSITMQHSDHVKFEVEAYNGAGLSVAVKSDGFYVDHTAPEMKQIKDSDTGSRYQSSKDTLQPRWQFVDQESGIKEYRYLIYEDRHGLKSRVWPKNKRYEVMPVTSSNQVVAITLSNLDLADGGLYSVHVTAINHALLSSVHESRGVIVDSTPPVVTKVLVALPGDEEQRDSQGRIEHVDPEGITVSWYGFDTESGISEYFVAIGTSRGDYSISGKFLDMGKTQTAYIPATFEFFSDNPVEYYITLKAKNGAGLTSNEVYSHPIVVLRANVPGVIFDGREKFADSDKTKDIASIAMSFHGFESEACNIVSYQWAIGSEAYYSDIMPYTEYGIVHNESHGHAEISIDLEEDKYYFTTVRAKTGHNCHEEYIVSSSNGISVDVTKPKISRITPVNDSGHYFELADTIYSNIDDSLDLTWNVSDQSDVIVEYSVDLFPFYDGIHSLTAIADNRLSPGLIAPNPGESIFLNLFAQDEVGNRNRVTSWSVTSDITPPSVKNFTCTETLSSKKSILSCSWETEEFESNIKSLTVSLGSMEVGDDLISVRNLATSQSHWSADTLQLIGNTQMSKLYVTLKYINIVNMEEVYSKEVMIDRTPPTGGSVDIVTWTDPKADHSSQQCQIPWTYVDVNVTGFSDPESGIGRAEVCLGTSPGADDVKSFHAVEELTRIFIGDISVTAGTSLYATLRIYNNVGLYSMVTSREVVVSPNPVLSVIDGPGNDDIDYQSDLNVLQGSWVYSDNCLVLKAEWAVENLKGEVVQDFIIVPGVNGNFFYNDHLVLTNGFMYVIKVRITDALNRTVEATSDGVTLLIQPPLPARVRDGLGLEDVDYQESTTELYVNWNEFGEKNSDDPSQTMDHYEVSIGDDNRNEITRINIHYFADVGLSTSHTFSGLNLTAKTVRYYITVRGYSITGAYSEEYSNGIWVGYRLDIIHGAVEVNPTQSSTDTLSLSWSGFESDIGLEGYKVAISTMVILDKNETFKCKELDNFTSQFDVLPLTEVGLDTMVTLENLTLQHGKKYFPCVITWDQIGGCAAVTGSEVLVDTTPPNVTAVHFVLNNWNIGGKELVFVNLKSELSIQLPGLHDEESGIKHLKFSLYRLLGCPAGSLDNVTKELVIEETVKDDTGVTFYNLNLQPTEYYYVNVTAINNAELISTLSGPVIRLDKLSPYPGTVKIAQDWYTQVKFQSSTSDISAWTAVARTQTDYDCPHTKQLFPAPPQSTFGATFTPLYMQGEYAPDFVNATPSTVSLKIGYNTQLTEVLKSGIKSNLLKYTKGSYSVRLKSASGKKVISTFSLSSKDNFLSHDFSPPKPTNYDGAVFTPPDDAQTTTMTTVNSSLSWNSSTTVDINNTSAFFTSETTASTIQQTTTPVTNTTQVVSTTTDSGISVIGADSSYGCGLHILGEQQNDSSKWDCLFWAYDKDKKLEEWFTLEDDPSTSFNDYTIVVTNETSLSEIQWNLELKINGETKATISGMQFHENMHLHIQTWLQDNYVEPLDDPFHPFRSEVVVSQVDIPLGVSKPCLQGKGFYDGESGITEMWVGVSDSDDEVDNIKSFSLYKSFCIRCKNGCEYGCDTNCISVNNSKDFELIPINLHNLNLEPTLTSGDGLNASLVNEIVNQTSYFVNVKMITLSGQEVTVASAPVMVDNSPPLCEYMTCTDPENTGLDQPAKYLGSNKTIGAYWSCEDNLSEVNKFTVSVGTSPQDDSLYAETDVVGLQSKIQIDLSGNKSFSHGDTYYVNMKVHNSAGLWNNYSCSVLAQLIPPDVTDTTPSVLFEDTSGVQLIGVHLISFLDRIGVSWNSSSNDTQYYEWQIGSTPGGNDILQSIIVGLSSTGSVSIIGGELWFGNNRTNSSIADYTSDTWGNGTAAGNSHQHFLFQMEPGRCVYPQLYAVGYSNLRSLIKSDPICIARPEDVRYSFQNSSLFAVQVTSGTGSFQGAGGSSVDNLIAVNLTSTSGGGGVVIGLLSYDDLNQQYGSATSTNFNTFLANPNDTLTLSTRFLRGRLIEYLGISIFVSPAPTLQVDRIRLSIKINLTDFDDDVVPALVFWDTNVQDNPLGSDGVWRHVDEGCGNDPITPLIEDDHYIVEICLSDLEVTTRRSRRSTGVTLPGPLQVAMVSMNTTYYNNPPVVDTSVVTCPEDSTISGFIIQWHDDDFDGVTFSMGQPAVNGTSNISSDGVLYYTPDQNFHGLDSVEVIITENTTSPASVSKFVTINVTNRNDPPVSGYVYNETVFETYDNKTLVLLFEGNQTDRYLIDYVVADIDREDSLTVLSSATNVHDVVFVMTEYNAQSLPAGLFSSMDIYTHRQFKVDMTVSKNFYGNFQYYILGHDLARYYTERLELQIYILWAPCVNGYCVPRTNESEPCDHITRSTTFDPYMCKCDAGFSGTWCEIDIDDCASNPCGGLYDCTDNVNTYHCTINAGKISAVILPVLTAVGILIALFIFWRKWQVTKNFKKKCNMPLNLMKDKSDREAKPVYPGYHDVHHDFSDDDDDDDEMGPPGLYRHLHFYNNSFQDFPEQVDISKARHFAVPSTDYPLNHHSDEENLIDLHQTDDTSLDDKRGRAGSLETNLDDSIDGKSQQQLQMMNHIRRHSHKQKPQTRKEKAAHNLKNFYQKNQQFTRGVEIRTDPNVMRNDMATPEKKEPLLANVVNPAFLFPPESHISANRTNKGNKVSLITLSDVDLPPTNDKLELSGFLKEIAGPFGDSILELPERGDISNQRHFVADGSRDRFGRYNNLGPIGITNPAFLSSQDDIGQTKGLDHENMVTVTGVRREQARVSSAGGERTSTPIGSETLSTGRNSIAGIDI